MTSAQHEEELHAFLDEELPEGDLARVEQELMASEEDRRSYMGMGVVLAIAAAAALGFFARDGFSAGRSNNGGQIAQGGSDGGAVPQPVAVLEEPRQGSEVVEVDFGGNAGTYFAVQGSAGQPLAVVWIEDEKPSL